MICKQCNKNKEEKEFYVLYKNRKRHKCIECIRENSRLWAINNPDKARLRDKNKYTRYKNRVLEELPKELKCSKCNLTKSTNEFYRRRYGSTGFSSRCKLCGTKPKTIEHTLRCKFLNTVSVDRKKGQFDTLDFDSYKNLLLSPCYSCNYNKVTGLDRIDNNKGHSINNVLPCCYECNIARNNLWTVEEMKQYIGPAIKAVRESRINNVKINM